MIGTNDVGGPNGTQPAQTLAQTETNLRSIIARGLGAPSQSTPDTGTVFVLLQPPPAVSRTVWEASASRASLYWRARTPQESGNDLQSVKTLTTRLAAEYDATLVPVWDNMAALGFDGSQASASVQAEFVSDGIHLTQPQEQRVADWVAQALGRRLIALGLVRR